MIFFILLETKGLDNRNEEDLALPQISHLTSKMATFCNHFLVPRLDHPDDPVFYIIYKKFNLAYKVLCQLIHFSQIQPNSQEIIPTLITVFVFGQRGYCVIKVGHSQTTFNHFRHTFQNFQICFINDLLMMIRSTLS